MDSSAAGPEGIGSPLLWGGFLAFVAAVLALDLGVFHRKDKAIGIKHALAWTGVWIALALAFDAGIWAFFGRERALEFLTGYLVEKSLSVDNIFVFVVVFGALAIPAALQHRVLFWGILGALVLRGAMILGGAALLDRFRWLVYVFGAFLIVTGIKMLRAHEAPLSPEDSRLLQLVRRVIPASKELQGHRFFTREGGRLVGTPLLVCLVIIEITDVIFAVDSIPAILAISTDTFIVFTSNIFAVLGLRSLYFALAGATEKVHYLKIGLAGVLLFVGTKMLLARVFHIPALVSLLVVALILGVAVLASWLRARRTPAAPKGRRDRSPEPGRAG